MNPDFPEEWANKMVQDEDNVVQNPKNEGTRRLHGKPKPDEPQYKNYVKRVSGIEAALFYLKAEALYMGYCETHELLKRAIETLTKEAWQKLQTGNIPQLPDVEDVPEMF